MSKLSAREMVALAKEFGADLVGIAPVSRWGKAPRMMSPTAHLPEAKSVIALSIHHPDASVEWGGLPTSNYSGPFQLGMIPKLDTISWRLVHELEKKGFASIPFPCTGFWRHRPYKEIPSTNTASFSHRHAFVACGLGEFGWNNMVLSPEYGPRNRLVSLITSAEFDEYTPLYYGDPLCDRCKMCEFHCPGKNYHEEVLLKPGYDEVLYPDEKTGKDKVQRYAKLNRFRCLWGEQFALDMGKLIEADNLTEESLYKWIESGTPRPGGEFGNCFRFCMTKARRYWDRKYSEAPRRRKEKSALAPEDILKEVIRIAKAAGVNRIAIQRNDFPTAAESFVKGYPVEAFNKAFPYVITLGRTLPQYPEAAGDNAKFLSSTTKVRVGMAAMDIARYIDDLGWEATQDWTETNNEAARAAGWKQDAIGPARATSTGGQSCFDIIKDRAKSEADKNIVIAGMRTDDVDGANAAVSSNSLFTDCPLPLVNMCLDEDVELDIASLAGPFVDKVVVAPASALEDVPGIIPPSKLLPGAKSVVVLASEMPRRMVELAAKQEAECAMSYAYGQYQLIRETLWAAHDVGAALDRAGAKSLPIADFAAEPQRNLAPYWEFAWAHLGHPDLRQNAPAAAAAGLGTLGEHGFVLDGEFGPRMRFSFLVTTAELKPTAPDTAEHCLHCGACAKACPLNALGEKGADGVRSRDEVKCRWSRQLGMVPETGISAIGWDVKAGPIPKELTPEAIAEANSRKDPLQLKGYKYPNQIDTVVERCLQACPVGKRGA